MTQRSDTSLRLDSEPVEPLERFLKLTGDGIDLHDVEGTCVLLASIFKEVSSELPSIEAITFVDRDVPGGAAADAD